MVPASAAAAAAHSANEDWIDIESMVVTRKNFVYREALLGPIEGYRNAVGEMCRCDQWRAMVTLLEKAFSDDLRCVVRVPVAQSDCTHTDHNQPSDDANPTCFGSGRDFGNVSILLSDRLIFNTLSKQVLQVLNG
jgi:hypothetical protein